MRRTPDHAAPTYSARPTQSVRAPRSLRMDLTLASRRLGPTTVIALAGELDIYTAPRLRTAITGAIVQGSYDLVVDLSAVDFLDSSGLHTLVGALKKIRTYDGSLVLVGPSERVLKIFRITHLTKVFDIQPTMPTLIVGTDADRRAG